MTSEGMLRPFPARGTVDRAREGAPIPYGLVSTSASLLLDTFRVPYTVRAPASASAFGSIRRSDESGPALLWRHVPAGRDRVGRLGGSHVFGRFSDAAPPDELGPWKRRAEILDESGASIAAVWESRVGSVYLPFDPDEAISNLLAERYVASTGSVVDGIRQLARAGYYGVRPLLPRSTQMALRRRFRSVQDRTTFPAWPTETALHDLYAFVLRIVEGILGEPLPWIAPWPGDRQLALVLTHDVERSGGYDFVRVVADLEARHGVTSAWYFVPERDYCVDDALVEELRSGGFEVGVHGLRHDGRDLSRRTFDARAPAMREYAERWGATGFRAPSTQRDWELTAKLGFSYDSSYSDVARYEPQPGGSCTWLPFFIGQTVELPITMPMDHTLFDLLGKIDESLWLEKVAFLRGRQGMALLDTHPDYLTEPGRLAVYDRFLAKVAADTTAWRTLPSEVADWWRRRAGSFVEHDGREWAIAGPAAKEGRLVLGAPREV